MDSTTLELCKAALAGEAQAREIEPLSHWEQEGSKVHQRLGEEALSAGRVACLVLAGGQGSRLGSKEPKGCYPISVIRNASLFQLLAERCQAASKRYGRPLQMAIMTSPHNDVETRQFLQRHEYFGLDPAQLSFILQDELPFFTLTGEPFYGSSGELIQGPAGNGFALKHLVEQGVAYHWEELGVQIVTTVLIDNPLADPFHAEWIGALIAAEADVAIRCVPRLGSAEKVGVVAEEKGRVAVVEYTELSETDRESVDTFGKPLHRLASIGLFCFSLPFIHKAALKSEEMPIHAQVKPVPLSTGQAAGYKLERYLFDCLPWSEKTVVLESSRELCFAPLKNKEGPDSPQTVREALLLRDRNVWQAVAGTVPTLREFELSAEFLYRTNNLIDKWKGKTFPNADYVSN